MGHIPGRSEHGFLSPAVRLMSRIKYPHKFALIGFLFALPLGLTIFFLVKEIHKSINFAQKEIQGLEYLIPVKELEENMQLHRGTAYALKKQPEFQKKLEGIAAKIDENIHAIDLVDRRFSEDFFTSQQWSDIKNKWHTLISSMPFIPDQEVFDRHTELIERFLALMAQVGDKSNLILDPDLDSYYLMETTVIRLPALAEHISKARALGTQIVENKNLTEFEKFQLINLLGLIQASQDVVLRNYEVTFRETNNPDFEKKLSGALTSSIKKTALFLNLLRQMTREGVDKFPLPEDYWAKATDAIQSNYELYDLTAPALRDLLEIRIQGFEKNKIIIALVTFPAILLVLFLFVAFYRAVMRTVKSLEDASKRMLEGNMDSLITLDSKDELSQVVESFNNVAVRLKQEWAQAREESTRATAAEAKLKESNERFQSLSISSPVGIFQTNADGQCLYTNPRWQEIAGMNLQESLGDGWNRAIHPEDREKVFTAWIQDAKAGREFFVECRMMTPSGSIHWVRIRSRPIFSQEGKLTGHVGTVEDITESKKYEKELQAATDVAHEASRAKSDFLATMSHEIRTPMNAVIGMAELLSETQLTHEQREYVDVLKRGGDNLLNLINNILDISKVEAGQIELDEQQFNLEEFLENAIEFLAIKAHQKGLELSYFLDKQMPLVFLGDSHRIHQILINLVGNSIKFTEKGEVHIEVKKDKQASAPDQKCRLLFSIRDTGIGIPPEKIATIFEPFTQADSSTTRKYGGTGLGLSISKKLVERMGGTIWIESSSGQGTTFYFTIPLEIIAEAKQIKKPAPSVILQDVKVLIVDDNATNRFVLKEVLASWGISTVTAETGEECLRELRRANETGSPFQLVLLDCRMPGMDGFEVAQRVKKEPSLSGTILMMLTSDTRSGDAVRAKQLQISGYLVKPIKKAELLRAIQTAVCGKEVIVQELRPKTGNTFVESGLPSEPSFRILIAEDAEDNRMLMQSYLKRTPYQFDIADNGEIACQKFMMNQYDLVFMDMHMPVKDGFEATQDMRQWEKRQNRNPIPIIALTASVLKEDIQKCFDSGCSDHLSKPIKKTLLLETISKYSEVKKAA